MKFEHPLADDSGRLRLACCRSDTVQGTLAPMAPTEHKVASRIVIAKCTHAEGHRRCCGLTKKLCSAITISEGQCPLNGVGAVTTPEPPQTAIIRLRMREFSTYSTRVTGE